MTILEILLLVLAIFGAIDLAGRGLRLVGYAAPATWRFVVAPLGLIGRFAHSKALNKTTDSLRIEGMLNQIVVSLRGHLPHGWLVRSKVIWVTRRSANRLGDGTVVLRMLPSDRTQENILNTIWYFISASIFPDTRRKLSPEILDAISLVIVRNSIEREFPNLIPQFDSLFVKSQVISETKALEKFADFRKLDYYGFLLGPYIREIEWSVRDDFDHIMPEDTLRISEAIERFFLKFEPTRRRMLNDKDWIHQDNGSSFAILLVSKPANLRPNASAYVGRVRQFLNRGVSRIYLLGRNGEFQFLDEVASLVSEQRELRGLEWMDLTRNYNGKGSGRAVAFEIDAISEGLRLKAKQARAISSANPRKPAKQTSKSVNYLPVHTTGNGSSNAKSELRPIKEAEKLVLQAIRELEEFEHDWVFSSPLVVRMKKIDPNFRYTDFGFQRLREILEEMASVEIEMRQMPKGPDIMYVRRL